MMHNYKYPVVLTIAGFDGSGGAGIQADMNTIAALGCYATSVLTALPVQNTTGVKALYLIPATVVKHQLETVLEDIRPDAIKIGMIPDESVLLAICDVLRTYPDIPIVYDPVMVASSGDHLMQKETISAMIRELFPLLVLVTPNLDEAAVLTNSEVNSVSEMEIAGRKITEMGCRSVLLKGGHLPSGQLTSVLFNADQSRQLFHTERIDTDNTHGTGCTLSAAIAAFIARGEDLNFAVESGIAYVHQAILSGKDVQTGKGRGPLNHFFGPLKLIKNEI
ncbi:bifunctional hydroxymethylpyrimidine kinase/phosphomethylpyrimidine kinase [Pedobacter antarcticus]|uniref:bifunctional hydroxymethylpyrimidine kinase/phosphomethylpyrimidine kinase n=1 Tax=Pedobacter antarcticus TaxID=34086 RepID=UPI0029311CCE|nr:bifunctional hydroxymethylpyrimidine kinase/phosphomethylpyrimidine kinase [Pedobacter antarcticus]